MEDCLPMTSQMTPGFTRSARDPGEARYLFGVMLRDTGCRNRPGAL
jgi:hypothetical protein